MNNPSAAVAAPLGWRPGPPPHSTPATVGSLPAVDVDGPSPGDLECWSVTTIIDVLEKGGLVYWSAEETAWAAIRNERTWRAMLEDEGEETAVEWLSNARFRRGKDRLSDSDFGTGIHDLLEQWALDGTRPTPTEQRFMGDLPAARACLDQFDRWLDDFQPRFLATEMTVFTPEYGIAGTSDGIMDVDLARYDIDGREFFFDYKSSKKSFRKKGQPTTLYPDIGLQIAAYRHATYAAVWNARRYQLDKNRNSSRRYYLLNPDEQAMAVPVPATDGGLGIKITPEHCTVYPIRCDQVIYNYFLNCLELARFAYGDSRTVIGPPLTARKAS